MESVCPRPGEHGPLFLLDGNNMAFRAFYALPSDISTSLGFPTNALYGFSSMIIKILDEYRPAAVIVAWDCAEKTFRHEDFEEYKAQRKPMPELLSEQWPFFVELSEAFGFMNLALPGYEADDILSTLARQAEVEGRETVIVTGDRDALQLAGRYVRIMANTRGVTEVKIYDPTAVEERFGVPPRLMPDLIGLKGDTSDNIPGIPGIGEKTAAQLLAQFGSLEEVLAHANEVSGPKRRELLVEHRETALLSKRLALLDVDVPLDITAAEVQPHRLQREKIKDLFARFEFTSLLSRLESLLPDGSCADDQQPQQSGSAAGLPPSLTPPADTAGWASCLDWGRPVGLAAGEAAPPPGGEAAVVEEPASVADSAAFAWLAQADALCGPEDYGTMATVPVLDFAGLGNTVRPLLAQAGVICHDLKSSSVLQSLVEQAAHDTYIAAYLLAPGRRDYALTELAAEEGIRAPACDSAEPGAVDAALVLAVAARQERALREQGMWELFRQIELPLTGVLIAMERAGIYLDCYQLGEITGKIQDQLEELETRIYELAGEQFNLGSSQQLGRVLFDHLGLPRRRKTKTGYSTDAKTLESLADSHPIIGYLLNHRELSKLMSTYLLALPPLVNPVTGRLHTTFNQTATATGRLSSSDPNLQNIPVRSAVGAQIRRCFRAEPGYTFVVADYSQIELRIMAHLSTEPTLLESFRAGEDIHTRTAAEVFELAEAEVDQVHRRYAKAVNFGIMYGISAFGLSRNLGIEKEQAAGYIQAYFERLPRVKAFIEATIETGRRQGYVATVFGRRRAIPELASPNQQTRSLGERLAVNSVIQGTAADIIKVAMVRCHGRLQRECPGARLVLQVHDELAFEVPESLAEIVKAVVVEEMVRAFPMDPPLGVDVGIGPDWLSAK
ncbi:MAG: DNA polymerase I [Thermoleophilia bacterium]